MLRHTRRLFSTVANPRLGPQSRFTRQAIFWGASGVLCCSLTATAIYLDGPTNHNDTGKTERPLLSSLKRRKSTESFGHQPIDIDSKLREHEESHIAEKSSGVAWYDIVQVSSNDPNEDDHSTAIVPHPQGSWSLFAVFDGHSGWETSAWLRENLVPAVIGSLADLYAQHNEPSKSILSAAWKTLGARGVVDSYTPPGPSIDETIKNTFTRLDDDIVHKPLERIFSTTSKSAAINLLAPAYAGSCALLAFFDSHTRLLRVAVTGDSRALLGRRIKDADGNTKYEVHVLSVDQDGLSPSEIQRLNNSPEHPGEEVIKNGRVLGMGPSRAFGDARWKWSADTQRRLHFDFLGRSKPQNVLTPPYLTAEPVITTTRIERGDFLIMATDGLWECLQNEEAVGLVGAWLDRRTNPTTKGGSNLNRTDLPVVNLPADDGPVRYRQWSAKKVFVNVDGNAATHLARNALGGANADLAEALFSMRTPRARTYRDDITAFVVFFDDEE